MKTKITTSLAVVTCLLASSAAYAQTQAQDTPRQTHSTPNQVRSAQQVGHAEATTDELKVSEKQLRNEVSDVNKASKIIGMEVRNLQNERVGKIQDIAINLKDGSVAYAVLNAGGGMFGGGKLVALPMDALTAQPGENHFVINADKDRLAAAPGFSDDNWPNLDATKRGTAGLSAATVETEEERDAREDMQDARTDAAKEQRRQQERATEPRRN